MTFPRQFVLPAALLLSLATVPMFAEPRGNDRGQVGPDRPIQVNCTRGDSVQQALDRFPERSEQFTIEISGFCQEKLVISRKVILRGTDRNTDGITSPADLGTATATINVHGVTGFGGKGFEMVRLEHLSITGSPSLAVTVNTAQLGLTDVTISQNGSHGLLAFAGGSVFADGVTFADNGGAGIFAAAGPIRCTNCQITGNSPNGGAGVVAGVGGSVQLFTSTVTGRTGVQANGGDVLIIGGSIAVTTRAVIAQSAGRFHFQNDVQVTGGISCGLQSYIDSRRGAGTMGLHQLSNAGVSNQILNGCFLLAGPGTTVLTGQTAVGAGAYVATEGPPNDTTLTFGSLGCSNGGKVTTTGGTIIVGNVPGVPLGCKP